MIIKSIRGSILYKSQKNTFKLSLEDAVINKVDLSHGDFRGEKLYGANLEGLLAPGACFWGADCRNVDLAGADLRDADLRNIDFKDACLAEANLAGANLSGSYFCNTILRCANLSNTLITCPSFFSCDLRDVDSIKAAVYCHRGEQDISLGTSPVVITGLSSRMVFFDDTVLWRDKILRTDFSQDDFLEDIKELKHALRRFL